MLIGNGTLHFLLHSLIGEVFCVSLCRCRRTIPEPDVLITRLTAFREKFKDYRDADNNKLWTAETERVHDRTLMYAELRRISGASLPCMDNSLTHFGLVKPGCHAPDTCVVGKWGAEMTLCMEASVKLLTLC